MKNTLIAGAFLAASFGGVSADLCSEGSTDDNGNYYCQQVKGISFTGLNGSGSYYRPNYMDTDAGTCTFESSPQSYSGSMAPLDGQLSLHLRGPLVLNKFAAYSAGSSTSSKKLRRRGNSHRHGHSRFHEHRREVREAQEKMEKRGCGDMVYDTMDGKLVSWTNTYGCATSATAAPDTADATADATPTIAAPNQNNVVAASSSSSSAPSATAAAGYISNSGATEATGSWAQTAYYDSSSSSAKGLTFLTYTGAWSQGFGNSLSFAGSDGNSGASSSQVLAANAQIGTELVIMSDTQCSNGDCGFYTRPGMPTLEGFGGAEKAFYFEFSMPQDTSTGNMPAIWALNSQIPLTQQYGNCSCWNSGCGEMDIFEVLAAGDNRAKATLHGNSPCDGGDSDYFARPVDGAITVGVIMLDGNIHIQTLDSFDWPSSLSSDDVNGVAQQQLTQSSDVSIFALAS